MATITAILARWTEAPDAGGVVFTGSVRFSADTQEHVRATVLPLAHRICRLLGLAPGGFEISAVNLAAASQLDLGMEISGFSADLPLLLAMLSARLHMPVPQEVMCTGHIASPDGDVRVVRNLPAKLDAARADTSIRRIILPTPDADASLASLAATERAGIVAATARARERQEVSYVRDVAELLARVFPEEAVIVAALAGGYFGRGKGGAADAGPTGRAAAFLAGSPARFYEALASAWMADDAAPARELLQAWMDLHVARERYPRGIGRALLGIVHTLPSSVLYGKLRWPLAPVGSCIALTQHASARDAQDVLELYEAISRPPERERTASRPHDLPAPPARSEPASVLESLLAQLEAQELAATVALPIDTARGSFTLRADILEDHDRILGVVTSFYTHLLRRTDSPGARADKSRMASDASALLERAFARDGGATAGINEARTGTRGGLRFVLDQMTEQHKRDRTEERVREVILSTLGPLEFSEKVAFIREFFTRFPAAVPPECAGEPPERYAEKCDLIVRAYVDSKEFLEREYRRRHGDIVSAFNDAHDGTNGRLREILDTIADGLKATPLERLLREIEPVPDQMDRVFDRALNTLAAPPAIVTDWDAYASLLGRFHDHLEKTFYGVPPPHQDEASHCALCWTLLAKELGRNAEHTAFEIARTGAEGGVLGLLRTAARLYSQDRAEQRVNGLVAEYWNSRSVDERHADADEYIARYRHALPSEVSEGSLSRIHLNLFKVLQQHPFVMRRLRRKTG